MDKVDLLITVETFHSSQESSTAAVDIFYQIKSLVFYLNGVWS